jgi:hypothetical protein
LIRSKSIRKPNRSAVSRFVANLFAGSKGEEGLTISKYSRIASSEQAAGINRDAHKHSLERTENQEEDGGPVQI